MYLQFYQINVLYIILVFVADSIELNEYKQGLIYAYHCRTEEKSCLRKRLSLEEELLEN